MTDTDHTKKDQSLDILRGDHLYLLTASGGVHKQYAAAPLPLDGAREVSLNPLLSWTPGDEAIAHNVYLGSAWENFDMPAFAGLTEPSCQLSEQLAPMMTYYWRG